MPDENTERAIFFARLNRAQRERLERFHGEERKRFMLRCASNGGMRHHSTRKIKITLPKITGLTSD